MHEVIDVPLMRPRLARAEEILPYLAEIDDGRQYSNAGPLLADFEKRLAARFGVEPRHVACVANATLGLVLCLLALDLGRRGRCIIPSWTFEATAVAVRAAGLEPWFHDVCDESWALRAEDVLCSQAFRERSAAAVIVVSPFGAKIDLARWDAFTSETGLPVIADAAAAFDSLVPARTPAVLSLHATKLVSTGEGGAVICTDAAFIERVRQLANYGFEPTRRIVRAGVNAKMSEYAAAVGLAELARWPAKRQVIEENAHLYRGLLGGRNDVTFAPGFAGPTVQPTCNIKLANPRADALIGWLATNRIGARKWWGNGCHRQFAFASSPRGELPVTEALADSVVGLPFFADITRAQLERVAGAVSEFLQEAQ